MLPEALSQDLLRRFDVVYGFGVKQLQCALDQTHCGLASGSLLKDNVHSEWSDEKKTNLFIKTAAEWRVMAEEQTKNGEGQCRGTGQCAVSHRISFIMEMFREHFLTQIVYKEDAEEPAESQYLELFTQCLGEYGALSLLNDFDHLRTEHALNINEQLRDCQVPGPHTQCSRTLRTLRERRDTAKATGTPQKDENSATTKWLHSLDERQRFVLEISMKTHSFLNHSIAEEDGDQKDEEMLNGDGATMTAGNTVSKFVNEMDGGTEHKEQTTKMDDLDQVLKRGGVSKAKCGSIFKWLRTEQFDTETMRYDLKGTLEDHAEDSNVLSVFKGNQSQRLRVNRQFMFHFEALKSFTFGYCHFFPWKYFENRPAYIKKPKYGNLKEECLNNEMYPISLKVFKRILVKALHQRPGIQRLQRAPQRNQLVVQTAI